MNNVPVSGVTFNCVRNCTLLLIINCYLWITVCPNHQSAAAFKWFVIYFRWQLQCENCEIITGGQGRSQEFLSGVPTADHSGGVPMLDLWVVSQVPEVPKIWMFLLKMQHIDSFLQYCMHTITVNYKQ